MEKKKEMKHPQAKWGNLLEEEIQTTKKGI
jgi:hypothetical protein